MNDLGACDIRLDLEDPWLSSKALTSVKSHRVLFGYSLRQDVGLLHHRVVRTRSAASGLAAVGSWDCM